MTEAALFQDDEAFLDGILDEALERLAAGSDVSVDDLIAGRFHLRGHVAQVLAMAQAVAVRHAPTTATVTGYDVIRVVGEGAMGIVYEARHLALDRHVALKVLPPAAARSRSARERFLAEARALASLRHPSVVQIYDVIDEGAVCAYAMELVDGWSLAEILRAAEDSVPLEDVWRGLAAEPPPGRGGDSIITFVCRVGVAVARALGEVHRAGLLHRDVKPSNVLIRRDGTALLSDFGLVRDVDAASRTESGQFLGTIAYAAPEQLRGNAAEIGPATDVYALGVTLYHALTQRLPFRSDSPMSQLRAIESGALTPARRVNPRLPRDLETVVAKAMEPDPAARYRSGDDLADELERVLQLQPIRARPPGLAARALKFSRRNRLVLLAAALGGIVVMVVAMALWLRAEELRARPARLGQQLALARTALLDPRFGERTFVAEHGGADPGTLLLPVAAADEALRHYEAALELDPTQIDVRRERDVVAFARARLGAATPLAEREISDATGGDRRAAGLLAFLVGRADTCTRFWDGLDLAPSPGDPLVDLALGELYLIRDRGPAAYLRLFRAHEAFPKAGFIAVDLADAARMSGDLSTAERLLGRARQLMLQDPYDTIVRVEADLRAAQGRRAEARERYESMAKNHRAPTSRYRYAQFLEQQANPVDTERAIEIYRRLVEAHPAIATYRAALRRSATTWWNGLSFDGRSDVVARGLLGRCEVSLPALVASLSAVDDVHANDSAAVPVGESSLDSRHVVPMDISFTLEVSSMTRSHLAGLTKPMAHALGRLALLADSVPAAPIIERLIPLGRRGLAFCVVCLVSGLMAPRAMPQNQAWCYEFEACQGASLPNALDPTNIGLLNNTGSSAGSLYSVSNGALHQTTIGASAGWAEFYGGDISYWVPAINPPATSVSLNFAQDFIMEARIRVATPPAPPSGTPYGGVFMEFLDGQRQYALGIGASGITVTTSAYTLFSQTVLGSGWNPATFHTYRLSKVGGQSVYSVAIDGVVVQSSIPGAVVAANRYFGWGKGAQSTNQNAQADWDFVRVFNGPGIIALSAPPSVVVSGPGCGGIGSWPMLGASAPVLGAPIEFAQSGAPPGSVSSLVASLTPAGPLSLPGGCAVYVDVATMTSLGSPSSNAAGAWSMCTSLPFLPGLAGGAVVVQAVTIDPSTPVGFQLSNGLSVTLGF